jgi:hypothetical protein
MSFSDPDLLETLAELCTLLVIIGLVLEYMVPVFSYFKKPWYERERIWPSIVHSIGPILVVAGIAGELLFHHQTNKLQRDTIIDLTARIAPREISSERQSKIIASLTNLPKPSFAFAIEPAPEPTHLMFEMAKILQAAGWKWTNCSVASVNTSLCGSLGYKLSNGVNIGTVFWISDIDINVPESRKKEWAPSVFMMELQLVKIPGFKVTAHADIPDSAKLDAIVITIGPKS